MRLSADEISAGWESVGRLSAVAPLSEYRMYTPLAEAADSFVRWAQSPQDRVHLGIPKIDAELRGIAPGEIAMMLGFAHGGKTLLLLHALRNNRDKHIAMFIPDEPKQLVLTKLTCIHHGIDARILEARVASDDQEAIDLLRSTAEEHFPNLAVFDQPLTASDMERAYNELGDVWGQAPDLVVVDYLDLVEAGETVPDKATFLKGFGRRHDIPMLVLHQTSRTAGADGKKLTMSSGAFGGEQQATSVIGVRRRKYEIAAEINELIMKLDRSHSERAQERLDFLRHSARIHEHTVTVSLLKNKRPAGQLVDDVDFELDAATGRLTSLDDGALPDAYHQLGIIFND
jgi:replicative DNA helicase